jgi:hypothetical protein
MSDKRRDDSSGPKRDDEAERDAVIAADDTGLVGNEADIIAIEEREGGA